ncbi:ribose-phosphate diphosphokinase [Dictyobacter aurantiacus]|uniref:ribose-phosphate diphosphokinase n=1 Tax=Dictyobacter aurantiacus TaxID=1936993 RepID=A0A401ZH44_9CHLR|nr:ribose-phosphate diphosphokinase [Dictyobacter aurantiacus]GCE06008.1 ribose-phosphate pyrophosphokinase [Dictyobacter aurantiacus]
MRLFTFPCYRDMGDKLCASLRIEREQFSVERFANQELHATIQSKVAGEECLILGTIAPPDEQLLSFLLLSHTLRKEGAHSIRAMLPYLAYARDDKWKEGKSLATAWIGASLQAAGVDSVLTIDVHNTSSIHALFPLPVTSLSPAAIFAREIEKYALQQATIVSPDKGARDRCLEVARAAHMSENIIVLEKTRTAEGVVHEALAGEVRPQAIVVDDILDTGGTLVSCCEQLRQRGVEEITLLITHGLFTGSYWQKLWSLGVKRIICTDTIPQRADVVSEHIKIVSVLSLLDQYLAHYL